MVDNINIKSNEKENTFVNWAINHRLGLTIWGIVTLPIYIGVGLLGLGILGYTKFNKEASKGINLVQLQKTKNIGVDNKRLFKLKAFFEENILDDEKIDFIIYGEANNNSFMTTGVDTIFKSGDVLVVTNDRVIIRKGGFGKMITGALGEQFKSYYYSDITSVNISSTLGRYFLEINVAGENKFQENVFEYTKAIKSEMSEICKNIQQKIRDGKRR